MAMFIYATAMVLSVGLLISGLVMLTGRGAFMLGAWYTSLTDKEKNKYDEQALCRFNGVGNILISVSMIVAGLIGYLGIDWLSFVIYLLSFWVAISFWVYSKKSKRFLKTERVGNNEI
jgi:uncharacterized membrane protein